MNQKPLKLHALILGLVFATVAHGNLILNGSFEDQAAEGDGLGGLLNWTVQDASATDNSNFFGQEPTDGTYLALFPAGDDWVEQTLTTVIGQSYQVSFDWALAVNGSNERSGFATVSLNGSTEFTSPTFDESSSQVWQPFSFNFVADNTSTTVRFTNNMPEGGSQSDAFMDKISVVAVPEPSSLALLGLAAVSLLLRHRWRLSVLA